MSKMKYLLILLLSSLAVACSAQTVTDYDGNSYNTIIIGSQTWMQSNLKVTHFNNGVPIPTTLLAAPVDTSSLFQWAYNDDTTNINAYGRLYTWFTVVNSQNVCPSGWRVPDTVDWVTLTNFLGGDSIAGRKLKGMTHWSVTDSTVNNSSLFTGLPGGFRGNPSGYTQLGSQGNFWSATPFGSSAFQRGVCYHLFGNHSQFLESVAVANCGMSVRCIKNAPVKIEEIRSGNEIELFPNPSSDKVFLISTHPVRCVSICDLSGNLVYLRDSILEKKVALNTTNLPDGLYFIRVTAFDGVTTIKRLVVSR